jgi:hypothetical protein
MCLLHLHGKYYHNETPHFAQLIDANKIIVNGPVETITNSDFQLAPS